MTGDRPFLSPRFYDALELASDLHRDQVRKGTSLPYISHLVSVAMLVLEYGGDEDQAIAALLHDCIEDQGDKITCAWTSRPMTISQSPVSP